MNARGKMIEDGSFIVWCVYGSALNTGKPIPIGMPGQPFILGQRHTTKYLGEAYGLLIPKLLKPVVFIQGPVFSTEIRYHQLLTGCFIQRLLKVCEV